MHSPRFRWFSRTIFLLLGANSKTTSAQRPSNASICDYYAISLYGANTSDTQWHLMQGIVALAFGGGANLPNVSSDITGIFNPGTYNGLNVDLQPWFNGSIDSTNLNNQPVGIDWLDGGGLAPLHSFLNGSTANVTITNTTNEYRLFSHFFSAFSHIFGCTLPQPQPATTGGFLSLAYVHKYMNLNQTDLGHFIDQLTKSTTHFGFSDDDSSTLSTQLNAQYNVRCAPPVNGQLYSLCQATNCPLAEPSPDCNLYTDLGPSGAVSTGGPTSTANTASVFSPSSISTSATSSSPTSSSSTTTTSTSAQTSTSAPPSPSSETLSPGGIAGVSIGGAAVLFAFIGVLIFLLLRHKKRNDPYVPNPSNPSYGTPSYTDQHASYVSGGQVNPVEQWSNMQGGAILQPVHEMESEHSPRFPGSPEMAMRGYEGRYGHQ